MLKLLKSVDEQADFDPTTMQVISDSKKSSRRRIPPRISKKVDEHILPPDAMSTAISIARDLEEGHTARAWEKLGTLNFECNKVAAVPLSTAQKLLSSLQSEIRRDADILFHDKGRLQQLYHQRLETLLTYVRLSGRTWDGASFCTIIDILGRLDLVERAEVVFRNMTDYCKEPATTYTYNQMAAAHLRRLKYADHHHHLSRGRRIDKILTLLHSMEKNGLKPDVSSFNMLLAAQSKMLDIQAAEEIYDMLHERNIKPDRRTLNISLDIYGKLNEAPSMEQALRRILDEMDTTSLGPDVVTYGTIIRNAVLKLDMETAEATLKSMLKKRVKPNIYIFAHLIVGYIRTGDFDKAHEVVHVMTRDPFNLRPTSYILNPLMLGYAKAAEYDKAYGIFKDMLKQEIPLDLTTYTILANMFVESPLFENAMHAADLLHNLDSISGKRDNRLDKVALTVLIEAHGLVGGRELQYLDGSNARDISSRRDRHVTAVKEAYQEILRRGYEPDGQAYTALLTAYARLSMPESAWRFWKQLRKDNVKLSTVSYNALIMALVKEKEWYPAAKAVFEDMVDQPLFFSGDDNTTTEKKKPLAIPSYNTYDLLIQGAFASEDYTTIYKLWKYPYRPRPRKQSSIDSESPASGKTEFMARTYYYILFAMLARKDYQTAQEVYEEFNALSRPSLSAMSWIKKVQDMAAALQ